MHAGAVEKCLRPRALLRKFSLVEHVFCLNTDRLATFNVASLEIVRTQLDIHYDLESFGAAYVGLEAALAEAKRPVHCPTVLIEDLPASYGCARQTERHFS